MTRLRDRLRRANTALLRRALRLVVRYRVVPEDVAALGIDRSKPVCYALHIRQLTAFLVLDEAARELGLPLPSAPLAAESLAAESLAERNALFFLTRRGQPSPLRSAPYSYARRLDRLIAAVRADPALDVQIVPVSVFWGRAPMRQDSVLGALLADSWDRPGWVRQFLRLLFHGRDTQIQIGTPLSLRESIGSAGAPDTARDTARDTAPDTARDPARDTATRRVARLLRARFRQDRELALGPNLSHRATLLNAVVRSDAVQQAIRDQESGETGELQARRFAFEIASDYSYPVVRACVRVLDAFWNRVYDGIDAHRFDSIAQAGAGATIVYVPCHRSHVDYLALSYVILQRGMSPPHVAAGANLNVPLLGPILRRGGAFFLRRSFRGEPLFAAVFREYLHEMIRRGYPIEYFVEGGRSRSGRMLPPRPGMLAMTLESHLRDSSRPLVFVPVWIGYEKLVEGETYVAESSGQPKRRESVMMLLRAVRDLRKERFGKLHLNVGEPIRLADFLAGRAPVESDTSRQAAVDALAREVVVRINDALVVNPVNLLAIAVWGLPRLAVDAARLAQRIDLLRDLLEAQPHSARQTLTPVDGASAIGHARDLRLVEIVDDPYGEIVRISEKSARLLDYQANNVLHAFALPSLIACVVTRRGTIERERLGAVIAQMQPFLRNELFVGWDEAEVSRRIDGLLETLAARGLVLRGPQGWTTPPPGSAETAMLESLARIMRQTLERNLLVIKILVQSGSGTLGAAELERRAIGIARRLALVHEGSGPDFADRASLTTVIATFVSIGLVQAHDGALHFGDAMLDAAREADLLLPEEVTQAIAAAATLVPGNSADAADAAADAGAPGQKA